MSKRVEFNSEVARILLDLADDRKSVKTDSQGPRLALLVPDDLWEKYEQYQSIKEKRKGK